MNEPQGYSGTYGSIATTVGTYTATHTVADNASRATQTAIQKARNPRWAPRFALSEMHHESGGIVIFCPTNPLFGSAIPLAFAIAS